MAILVTGGTKGIGLDIARAFAEPGVDVFLNYASDDGAAALAKTSIEARHARCHLIKGDVGTPECAAAVIEAVKRECKQLDQLVHAAVKPYITSALEADGHELAQAVGVNGLALQYLVRAALPLFVPGSTVFFLSSRGGRMVIANYVAVGISKALAESLVRYLAVELAPRGVRINCVAPSVVDTDAVRTLFGHKTDDIMRHAASDNPSGRAVAPEDYTGLIRYLASPAAAFIQGQVIYVNGGHNLMA
ncbi:MAG: SDR family oxidoreductase [Alphaproteobacteria bacterium]|nr:SDR family oxidoreductase [Alphaproteobacteria bacterium]